MLGCQTAHIALLVVDEMGWKSPFPTADVEARPAPLPVMTSGGGDHDRRSHSGSPCYDHCQLLSRRILADASSSRASLSAR
jgi:hypothetical protein